MDDLGQALIVAVFAAALGLFIGMTSVEAQIVKECEIGGQFISDDTVYQCKKGGAQ